MNEQSIESWLLDQAQQYAKRGSWRADWLAVELTELALQARQLDARTLAEFLERRDRAAAERDETLREKAYQRGLADGKAFGVPGSRPLYP